MIQDNLRDIYKFFGRRMELDLCPKKEDSFGSEAKPFLSSYGLDFCREASDFISSYIRLDQIHLERWSADANPEAYQQTRVSLPNSITPEVRAE
jgi:hypothetical protein